MTYLEVNGAKPGMKKCILGNGTMFTWIFLKSAFNCPGNLIQVVTPAITAEIRWFISPYEGFVSFNVLNNKEEIITTATITKTTIFTIVPLQSKQCMSCKTLIGCFTIAFDKHLLKYIFALQHSTFSHHHLIFILQINVHSIQSYFLLYYMYVSPNYLCYKKSYINPIFKYRQYRSFCSVSTKFQIVKIIHFRNIQKI